MQFSMQSWTAKFVFARSTARLTVAGLALAGLAAVSPARAAEPIGTWLVEGGYAHIKMDICGDKLWGIVAWEKKANVDRNNPDASKRSRPTLGIPILMGLTQSKPGKWEGEIYNSEDGRTYGAYVSMASEDVLTLEGCVLGFLCQSQSWTRVAETPAAAPASPRAAAPRPASPAAQAPAARRTTGQAPATPPASDVCMAVASATGQPIEQVMQAGAKRSER
jgi:uncharacterized protein (DUF2147 family)